MGTMTVFKLGRNLFIGTGDSENEMLTGCVGIMVLGFFFMMMMLGLNNLDDDNSILFVMLIWLMGLLIIAAVFIWFGMLLSHYLKIDPKEQLIKRRWSWPILFSEIESLEVKTITKLGFSKTYSTIFSLNLNNGRVHFLGYHNDRRESMSYAQKIADSIAVPIVLINEEQSEGELHIREYLLTMQKGQKVKMYELIQIEEEVDTVLANSTRRGDVVNKANQIALKQNKSLYFKPNGKNRPRGRHRSSDLRSTQKLKNEMTQ